MSFCASSSDFVMAFALSALWLSLESIDNPNVSASLEEAELFSAASLLMTRLSDVALSYVESDELAVVEALSMVLPSFAVMSSEDDADEVSEDVLSMVSDSFSALS